MRGFENSPIYPRKKLAYDKVGKSEDLLWQTRQTDSTMLILNSQSLFLKMGVLSRRCNFFIFWYLKVFWLHWQKGTGGSAVIRKSVQRTFPFLYIIWPFDFRLLLSSVLGNCVRAKAKKLYRLLIFTTVLLQLVSLPMNWKIKFHSFFLKYTLWMRLQF